MLVLTHEQAKHDAEEKKRTKLLRNMSCIRDVRKRDGDADEMFKPLEETGTWLPAQHLIHQHGSSIFITIAEE